ncbi:Crp/Fnr family transcriptional regulator [Flavobacterium sp. KACC 22763]|uniref:Crp/Fnr family transcriptional regulator n=1 Tax=Flavobacterium sp. KACC 22763 TaxID=3025668 RepID=UPI002365E737|nr:Crp/Fnr family transcriptional regulator [Flavobacterium sp. KACC 22763]WDF66593.1 Crp/Fnr family transcriptional regulator [Flavobacterium sp. KACC 22763]
MDNYNLLQENIRKRIEVTDDEMSYFIFLLQQKKYNRKQILHREGEISHSFTFIVSGCVKSYLIDKKGEEHILTIAPSDWWITDINSFVSATPGNLFMEAIEPATALLLSREKQELLLSKLPKFEKYFRILTEKAFAVSQQRIIDYMSLTALERLEKFVASYPSVISSLTQQQIASYIGVTPSFFSRMIKGKKIF